MSEGRRFDHLPGGLDRDLEPLMPGQHASERGPALRQQQQRVFNDDNAAVDHQAEVQRPQTHQIAADPEAVHADDGEQERQRDHQGGDGRRADIAQEQEQDHHHQQRPLGQVARHRGDGGVDQFAPVEHRNRDDSRRQAVVHLGQSFGGRLRHRATVAAGDHQGCAKHGLVAVATCCAQPQPLSYLNGRNIGDPDHQTASVHDGRLSEVFDSAGQRVRAYDEGFARTLDIAGSRLCVGALQRLRQIP